MICEVLKCLVIFWFILTISSILYLKWVFQFWKKRNFPYIKPTIPFGSISNIFKPVNIAIEASKLYKNVLKNNLRYAGFFAFHMHRVVVTCPKLMEQILQKDFNHFTDRGFYYNEINDPLSANLFAIGGEKWRIIRNKLSPSFTLAKLKAMFPIMNKCGCDLKDAILSKCMNKELVDVKDIAMSYTINVIASCGFDLECNCFKEHTEFKNHGHKVFDLSSTFRYVKIIFAFICTNAARCLGIKMFDYETNVFFTHLLKETIKFRKNNKIIRHDMINSIIELRNSFNDEEIKELAAQVFIFFAAGYETSSITLTFCFYELSVNNRLQEKLRQEIKYVLKKFNGQITYEALTQMEYMDQIINETLRKYPPVPHITRVCVKDYNIPETDNVIPKGTTVDFSILGVHHNPEYHPDPSQFDPERFSKKNKHNISALIYIPFGAGPRKCIGMQLGLLKLKLALAVLLNDYSFTLHESTMLPLEFNIRSFTLIPMNTILLNPKKL